MRRRLTGRRFNRQNKEKSVPEKKSARSQAKPNIFVRFVEGIKKLIRETVGELKKVTWPTRQEATHLTKVVLVVILILGFYFFFIDSVLTLAVEALLGIS
jgi:preprotein translocase subunit SecE